MSIANLRSLGIDTQGSLKTAPSWKQELLYLPVEQASLLLTSEGNKAISADIYARNLPAESLLVWMRP